VTVSHRSGRHLDPRLGHRLVEAEVRHHGHRNTIPREAPGRAQVQGAQRDQLVAIHHGARAVDRQHPVAIAVEGEAHVEAAGRHRLGKTLDVGGAIPLVDVAPVGLGPDALHAGTEPPEDLGRRAVGGPVSAVEQHSLARQLEVPKARLELTKVVRTDAVELAHAARSRRGALARTHRGLDLLLGVVGQLHSIRPEELDAVVAVRVMRSGDDARQIEPKAADEQRGARGRQHATDQRVPARGGYAGGHGSLEHLPGLARVPDDEHLWGGRRRPGGGGAPEGQREVGGQELPGRAANAVGAEKPALARNNAH
jgi:hypothetical protein